jgi:hypothetical protein
MIIQYIVLYSAVLRVADVQASRRKPPRIGVSTIYLESAKIQRPCELNHLESIFCSLADYFISSIAVATAFVAYQIQNLTRPWANCRWQVDFPERVATRC